MKRKIYYISIVLLFLSILFIFTSCDEEESFTSIVVAMPSDSDVWTQVKVGELQSSDTRVLADGTVLGTLYYAAPGTAFSNDTSLQSGWYLCITIAGEGKYTVVSTRETIDEEDGENRDFVLLVGNATVGYLDSAAIVTSVGTVALDLTKLDLVARPRT